MRHHHVAAEKAFVDYPGKRIGIADPTTGEIREAEIFVDVLGASNLTPGCAPGCDPGATWTQTLRTYGVMAAHYSVGILSGAAEAAEGQGESRGRSQISADLHSGATALSDVFLARRMQRGDCSRHATHERASHAQPRPEPTRAVRDHRAPRTIF
jgi:hypothetical protein